MAGFDCLIVSYADNPRYQILPVKSGVRRTSARPGTTRIGNHLLLAGFAKTLRRYGGARRYVL